MVSIMNIEQLNKSQIVLLTLLVSFVTSIATGIVTVSLMEQAPPVIPQTINRVVERTVERVVPRETQTATVITTEKTIIVKEADLITQAVARARPSTVRIYAKGTDSVGDFLSRGIVLADGYAVAALSGAATGTSYVIQSGDKSIEAKVVKTDKENKLVLLALTEPDKEHMPAATANTSPVTLGQTVVALTGESSLKVASGITTSINEITLETKEIVQTYFETNIADTALVAGSAILNTDGAVIGMYTGNGKIIPATILGNLVSSIMKPIEKAVDTKDAKKIQ